MFVYWCIGAGHVLFDSNYKPPGFLNWALIFVGLGLGYDRGRGGVATIIEILRRTE